MTSASEANRNTVEIAEYGALAASTGYFVSGAVAGIWNPAAGIWAATGIGVHFVVNISSQALGLKKTPLGVIATHITGIVLSLFVQAAAITSSLVGIPFSASLVLSLKLAASALVTVIVVAVIITSFFFFISSLSTLIRM